MDNVNSQDVAVTASDPHANADARRRLLTVARDEEIAIRPGFVNFEYSVRVTSTGADHHPVHREKGSREELPREVAMRKQEQGLGRIVGVESPVARTMADLVTHDPLAPREQASE